MVLTVEGSPNVAACSLLGGCGNAHRVGHDIQPLFMSALSEADIASGLWQLAHNATNATNGGWYNDLDILEVGNGPDFLCGADAAALDRCRVHFTMHSLLKSPLLLGNDLTAMDAATLGVLSNAEAIAVNQDALGVQGHRVRVEAPAAVLPSAALPGGANAVWARCDSAVPTQAWRFAAGGAPPSTRALLFLVPCDAGDAWQRWAPDGAALRNAGAGACLDSAAGHDPAAVAPCTLGAQSQAWAWDAATGYVRTPKNGCLDVFDFVGPDVETGTCKVPGDNSANQGFDYDAATGLLRTRVAALAGQCIGVELGPAGLLLATTDAAGGEWLLGGDNFPVIATPGSLANASRRQPRYTLSRPGGILPPGTLANYSLADLHNAGVTLNNQAGASGPWPHTRYTQSYSYHAGGGIVTLDAGAALAGAAVPIQWADTRTVYDDDLVGGVTQGGAFCLDIKTAGMLETWVAPLTGGRAAVALLNRSPGADALTVVAADAGWPPGTRFAVRDVWAAADRGVVNGTYTAHLNASSVALLVLTPAPA